MVVTSGDGRKGDSHAQPTDHGTLVGKEYFGLTLLAVGIGVHGTRPVTAHSLIQRIIQCIIMGDVL